MSDSAPAFLSRYATLPDGLYALATPTPVSQPELLHLNEGLASALGLDVAWLRSEAGVQLLAGNAVPADSTPLAMAYAGHQFGHPVPQLGDGRAILLGERRGADGITYEVQLKGAGRTAFSRGGDGRNHIGPVLREYVVSEAMHALGIPTTRALSAVLTGEPVYRQTTLPGAIVTRVAESHVRVGTFEFAANRGDVEGLKALVDHVITHHAPDLAQADNTAAALLDLVVRRQAKLVAQWMAVGFIHGVMNTDNCSVLGLTIDYGPCAFMDAFSRTQVFSSIDRQGRYAYANQPPIAQWNAMTLARCLLPLLGENTEAAIAVAQPIVDRFKTHNDRHALTTMGGKLGLTEPTPADDDALIQPLLTLMEEQEADFTRFFRGLSVSDEAARAELADPGSIDGWLEQWHQRVGDVSAAREAMRQVNPSIIPRNHKIEAMITESTNGDHTRLHQLVDALADPFADRDLNDPLTLAPAREEVVHQTFCGT